MHYLIISNRYSFFNLPPIFYCMPCSSTVCDFVSPIFFEVSFHGCSVEIKDSCQISGHAYNEEESLIMLLPHYDFIAMLLHCTYYKAFVPY
jgi:hypothetical protein